MDDKIDLADPVAVMERLGRNHHESVKRLKEIARLEDEQGKADEENDRLARVAALMLQDKQDAVAVRVYDTDRCGCLSVDYAIVLDGCRARVVEPVSPHRIPRIDALSVDAVLASDRLDPSPALKAAAAAFSPTTLPAYRRVNPALDLASIAAIDQEAS